MYVLVVTVGIIDFRWQQSHWPHCWHWCATKFCSLSL